MQKNEHKQSKSIINMLRAIRDDVSMEVKDMTKDELKAYFKKKSNLHPGRYGQSKQTKANN